MKIILSTAVTIQAATATVTLNTVTISPPDELTGIQVIDTEFQGFGAFWEIGTVDETLFFSNDFTVGIGFEYYLLELGDRLNGPIAEGLVPVVTNLGPPRIAPFAFDTPQGPIDPLIDLPNFYLGFFLQTGSDFENGTFGWVEFANDGTGVLSVASSATAFDEQGIIVGTQTVIPEPSSAMLLGLCSFFAIRRKRLR